MASCGLRERVHPGATFLPALAHGKPLRVASIAGAKRVSGIASLRRFKQRPTPKDVLRIGAPWRPHATVASWYLWRSLENGDGQL